MTFSYRAFSVPKINTGVYQPKTANEPEVILDILQGKKVPKDEYRFYKAAYATGKVRSYYVQFNIGARGFPGYRTVDALINTDFGWRAFEVDGVAFVHKTGAKKAMDRLADLQRMAGLRRMGIVPLYGIEHVPDTWLNDQASANRKARELLG